MPLMTSLPKNFEKVNQLTEKTRIQEVCEEAFEGDDFHVEIQTHSVSNCPQRGSKRQIRRIEIWHSFMVIKSVPLDYPALLWSVSDLTAPKDSRFVKMAQHLTEACQFAQSEAVKPRI